MVESSIPQHITGIYVFAVVNLLALLCVAGVDADVVVKDLKSNETAADYPDMQAGFGPDFPADKGLQGRVIYADPKDACAPLKKKAPPQTDQYVWILLIARGGNCQFADKVVMAQTYNYSAAIIHNYEGHNSLVHMSAESNGSRVRIPSTFVGWNTGMDLHNDYDYRHKDYIVQIIEDEDINYRLYLWPFAIVVAVCFFMVMIFLLVKFLRDHAHQRLNRLSKKHLKKIPVRKFKKGDYYDTCAICLDEYEEGEKIRVLPCDHVYHTKCIDPWLTKNKKTCPVCKRRVIPGRDADSDSDSDDGDLAGRETTPLLRGASPNQGHRGLSLGADASGMNPQRPAQPSQGGAGPMVSTVDEYGAMADHDTMPGAVGGVGISDSHRGLRPQPPAAAATREEGGERRDGRQRRKRERRSRREEGEQHEEERGRRSRREEGEQHEDDNDETAPLMTAETKEERKERRKKKKERKKKGEKSSKSPDEVAPEAGAKETQNVVNVENDEQVAVADEQKNEGAEGESERREEENKNDQEGYINPSYSESQEVVVPGGSRRHEMDEMV